MDLSYKNYPVAMLFSGNLYDFRALEFFTVLDKKRIYYKEYKSKLNDEELEIFCNKNENKYYLKYEFIQFILDNAIYIQQFNNINDLTNPLIKEIYYYFYIYSKNIINKDLKYLINESLEKKKKKKSLDSDGDQEPINDLQILKIKDQYIKNIFNTIDFSNISGVYGKDNKLLNNKLLDNKLLDKGEINDIIENIYSNGLNKQISNLDYKFKINDRSLKSFIHSLSYFKVIFKIKNFILDKYNSNINKFNDLFLGVINKNSFVNISIVIRYENNCYQIFINIKNMSIFPRLEKYLNEKNTRAIIFYNNKIYNIYNFKYIDGIIFFKPTDIEGDIEDDILDNTIYVTFRFIKNNFNECLNLGLNLSKSLCLKIILEAILENGYGDNCKKLFQNDNNFKIYNIYNFILDDFEPDPTLILLLLYKLGFKKKIISMFNTRLIIIQDYESWKMYQDIDKSLNKNKYLKKFLEICIYFININIYILNPKFPDIKSLITFIDNKSNDYEFNIKKSTKNMKDPELVKHNFIKIFISKCKINKPINLIPLMNGGSLNKLDNYIIIKKLIIKNMKLIKSKKKKLNLLSKLNLLINLQS